MLALRIALCFSVMLHASSNAQTPRSKEREALKGPVRTVTVETVRLSNEDKELRRKKVENVSYDVNRRPKERDVYDDYGFLAGKEFYQYGPTGLMSRSMFSDASSKRTEVQTYQYD